MESYLEGLRKPDKTAAELTEMATLLLRKDIANDEVMIGYSNWAVNYDKDVLEIHTYKAPMQTAEEIAQVIGDNYDAKLCDFACGTGLAGAQVTKLGYRHIEGIDGNANMLTLAARKGVYKNLVHSHIGKNKIDSIADDSYDAMFTCGSFHPGHLSPDCFEELIRMTKPGGHIIILLRCCDIEPDIPFLCDFEPKLKRFEEKGLWKLLARRMRPEHYEQADGFVFILKCLMSSSH